MSSGVESVRILEVSSDKHHANVLIASVDRVKWFRDRADRDRLKEEVRVLDAEFQRTLQSRTLMSQTWMKLALKNTVQPGAAAYAHKQSSMYNALADECAKLYQEAKATVTCANAAKGLE